MKSDFEAMGGTYTREGDYLLPDVASPEGPRIGIWGERRCRYLREHKKPLYTGLLLSNKLHAHLEEVDQSANEMFARIVAQLKSRDGITETLKVADPSAWVQAMNLIHHEAAEVVMKELIAL